MYHVFQYIFSVTLRYPNMLFPFAYLLDCIATLIILLYFITVLQESVVLCRETQILSAFCFYLLLKPLCCRCSFQSLLRPSSLHLYPLSAAEIRVQTLNTVTNPESTALSALGPAATMISICWQRLQEMVAAAAVGLAAAQRQQTEPLSCQLSAVSSLVTEVVQFPTTKIQFRRLRTISHH